MINFLCFFFFLSLFFPVNGVDLQKKYDLTFDKVVIWGHKLHTHTHSYIHYGYFKAFKHLGYETFWFDNSDCVSTFDFSNTLFFTAGNCDEQIPLRDDCFYVLHCCNISKYKHLFERGRCVDLRTYWHSVRDEAATFINDFTFYNLREQSICMPWATDLLPHEIDGIKKRMPFAKERYAYFIGSKHSGNNSTDAVLSSFQKACKENNIQFKVMGMYSTSDRVSNDEHMRLIQDSLVAPTLQGKLQVEERYIPCRIFKNISYGQLGITNSKAIYEFFNKKIVYNPDAYQLCYDALERLKTVTIEELHELMDFVKTEHTYLNRIDLLLTFFDLVYNNFQSTKTLRQ